MNGGVMVANQPETRIIKGVAGVSIPPGSTNLSFRVDKLNFRSHQDRCEFVSFRARMAAGR